MRDFDICYSNSDFFGERFFIFNTTDISDTPSKTKIKKFSKYSIVREDLLFTLKQDPTKYLRPLIIAEENEFRILGNKQDWEAVRDSGIEKIACDILNINSDEYKNAAERFFHYPAYTKNRAVRKDYLFFENEVDIKSPIDSPFGVTKAYFQKHEKNRNCFLTFLEKGDIHEKDYFFKMLVSSYLYNIRSINGRKFT